MILHEYIKGDMKLNRKSYSSTVISIFLAVLILSTFVFGVTSYYKSYRDLIGDTTGGYHFRLVDEISKENSQSIMANRHIKKIGLVNSKELDQAFGSKEKTMFVKMDQNALSTIESWVKEGSLPKDGELMISNDMSRETGKSIGDSLELDGEVYKISAIYYDITYEFDQYYNVYLGLDQDRLLEMEDSFSPFIWYKNIFKTYSLSQEIMDSLDQDHLTYNFNLMYLDRSFVFDPDDDFLTDHSFQIVLIVLFFILLVLFYFIISNLFLVQEAKSVEDYARLKAIGASQSDIGRLVRLKAIYISQLPIILGILASSLLVKILFYAINRVEKYFADSKGILESNLRLSLDSNLKFIISIYLISSLLIYLASKKPIRRLKSSSILDGLKGNIGSKSYKQYDLDYRGDIEKDLARHFYKNSRKSFRSSALILKLGFSLMSFIMILLAYLSIEQDLNSIDKYNYYNIQARYASLAPLNEDMIADIKELGLDDFINFRNESVYLDYDESLIDEGFLKSGSLERLEDEIDSLNNIRINIIGVEDYKFRELVQKQGLNPDDYRGNRVLLLNSLAERFDQPSSKISYRKLLRDDLEEISLSEYGSILETRGYEFKLDVRDKLTSPLFDYPLKKDRLHAYMPKSEYMKLLASFEKIADLDQFETIAIKTDSIEERSMEVKDISQNYFKELDFELESKLDEDNLRKKRDMIGNVLLAFFSVFFIIIGFSNSYFVFYNLFIKRRQELLLYRAIGLDQSMLNRILKREKNKINLSFILSMPFILIGLALIVASSSKVFTGLDILLNINYIFVLVYILAIYLALSKMYNNYKKEILD